MTKELIEKYLQFAIENWYKWLPKWTTIKEFRFFINEKEVFETWSLNTLSITDIITSWPFIEAIFRGWYDKYDFDKWMRNKFDTYWWSDIDKITFAQAIAIRDNKLDEFIKDLLPKN
jgi:hypothetical protein